MVLQDKHAIKSIRDSLKGTEMLDDARTKLEEVKAPRKGGSKLLRPRLAAGIHADLPTGAAQPINPASFPGAMPRKRSLVPRFSSTSKN